MITSLKLRNIKHNPSIHFSSFTFEGATLDRIMQSKGVRKDLHNYDHYAATCGPFADGSAKRIET